jgi:hypothetical protein
MTWASYPQTGLTPFVLAEDPDIKSLYQGFYTDLGGMRTYVLQIHTRLRSS